MTPDPSGMLAGMCAAPDDLTARGVFADWLEENGEPERAEFVRVGCKLVECGHLPGTCQDYECRCMSWARRSRELLESHEQQWRAAGPCETCGGKGEEVEASGGMEPCNWCHGTGDQGGLLKTFLYPEARKDYESEPVRIDWSRYPLLTLRVPRLSDCVENRCTACGRTGCSHDVGSELIPTPWLAAVVRHHPEVIGVESLDRSPVLSWRDMWAWFKDTRGPREGNLVPSQVFVSLPGEELCLGDDPDLIYKEYVSREEAVTALGRTVVQFAQSFVKNGH